MRWIYFSVLLMAVMSLPAQQKYDLVINEVLFNPRSGGSDFVEIYNRSTQTFNLKNIRIAGRNTNGMITIENIIIATDRLLLPAQYCLLTTDSNATGRNYTILNADAIIEVTKLPSMPDDNGKLVLKINQGLILDELHYDEKWHFNLLNNKEGISLERIHFDDSTQKPANWHSASATSGFGTPGYRNSQAYIYEESAAGFTIDPEVFSPDNNGFDDYVTISYKFPEPGYVINLSVYNASGGPVKFLARNVLCGRKGYFRWDGLDENLSRLSRGIYILLIDCFNLSGKRLRIKKTITLIKS